MCPLECGAKLPEFLSDKTVELHHVYQDALHEHSEHSREAILASMYLCLGLKEDVATPIAEKVFVDSNWPYPLDFTGIPKHIIALSDQLSMFLTNPEAVESHFIFQRLKDVLEKKGLPFSRIDSNPPMELFDDSIPG